MVFFTSDTHFYHSRIIKYCNRPFKTINDMNDALIENWNAKVKTTDDVWHLGDFAFADLDKCADIVSRLNGNIHFVHGNHDEDALCDAPFWASSQPYAEIQVDGNLICLFHYAGRAWNRSHKGAYQFFGHTHNHLGPINRSIDVGVDSFNYEPVSFAEIKARLASLGLDEVPVFPPRDAA